MQLDWDGNIMKQDEPDPGDLRWIIKRDNMVLQQWVFSRQTGYYVWVDIPTVIEDATDAKGS